MRLASEPLLSLGVRDRESRARVLRRALPWSCLGGGWRKRARSAQTRGSRLTVGDCYVACGDLRNRTRKRRDPFFGCIRNCGDGGSRKNFARAKPDSFWEA